MALVYVGALVLSLLCAAAGGRLGGLTAALLEGAGEGITLALRLAGPICLWCGLSKVMEATGATARLAGLLTPALSRLFPRAWSDRETREALSGNVAANLLGLGSAATPLGLRAAVRMAGSRDAASDELCRLVVLNTASVQLIPATVAALRASLGAAVPLDILPAVWVTSLCSVAAGLLAAKLLSKWVR